jgi:hypothetical protein
VFGEEWLSLFHLLSRPYDTLLHRRGISNKNPSYKVFGGSHLYSSLLWSQMLGRLQFEVGMDKNVMRSPSQEIKAVHGA